MNQMIKIINMKRQIRQSVFETNSSSTHSICIAKDVLLEIPKDLHLSFGEFGWEQDELNSTSEKASYLYTGLFANDRHEDIATIITTLNEKGINVTFESPNGKKSYECGYVDHSGELNEFLDAVCQDKEMLFRFLFSPYSFIITGNDNDECDVNINVNYEHDKFYKDN